jgi:hypothetical protein
MINSSLRFENMNNNSSVPPINNNNNNNNKPKINTTNTAFNKQVEDYLKNKKIHLCILTPTYGSVIYVNYLHCMIDTMNIFRELDIPLTVEFCKNDSLVSRARNNLVAKAMNNKDITHIMFIDADITWEPLDILKLIISDKSLIGGIYPLKSYQWDKLYKDPQNPHNPNVIKSWIDKKNNSQLKDSISDVNMVKYNLLKYNVNYLDHMLKIENNLTKVRHIATGFMMIKRNTIEQMMKAYPNTKYVDDVGFLHGNENDNAYALFDCGVEEGHYFSEDWLFCHRWSKMGGNIYLDVTINLTHTGVEDYNGSFISSLIAN